MKSIDKTTRRFEVYFLRMFPIKRKECTSFVLPKELSLKPGVVCTLVSSMKGDRDGPLKIRIKDVRSKPIRRLTVKEIEALHMDDVDEILDPQNVRKHCWFNHDAIDLLPEDHPHKWIDGGINLCEGCAAKISQAIWESCVNKATCKEFQTNGYCDKCSISSYKVGRSYGGMDSDSVGTCDFTWEENGEHKYCGELIEFHATNECAESEILHFMEHGFHFESDFDRHALKGIVENLDDIYNGRCKERTFLKKILFHAIWNTHWRDSYPYERNPVVGIHTFEIV